uniref:C-type lectin domain-containing protein n=1 Tax=Amphilophus citrinellus TaxID=61819 RepID=A0A3Q0SZQ4_AMPCI
MSMLTVCALVCTIVALAGSAGEYYAIYRKYYRKEFYYHLYDTHLVKTSSRCGGHWSEFNGRCFYYTVKPMAWAKAEKTCVSLGGHLALVHNFIEYQKLQGLIRRASREDKETWIGGTDAQENQWFWSDGTAFQYTDWCREEPNNSGGRQHCLQMSHGGTSLRDATHTR